MYCSLDVSRNNVFVRTPLSEAKAKQEQGGTTFSFAKGVRGITEEDLSSKVIISTNKYIYIPPPTTKKRESSKQLKLKPQEPKKRIITTTTRWDFQPDQHTLEYQLSLLDELREWWKDPTNLPKKHIQLTKQLIHSKWYGYRSQDIEKNVYCFDNFITEMDIVDLLVDSRLLCFYCRKEIQLLYEHVRETLQWSIERIDNKKGHNRGNVVIACLGCNLRRKTMYYERFRATKQMTISRETKVSPTTPSLKY